MTWFNKQSRLVQIILLLIPFVNWVTELFVRRTTWAEKRDTWRLVVCLIVTIVGIPFAWIDLIWILWKKELFLQ